MIKADDMRDDLEVTIQGISELYSQIEPQIDELKAFNEVEWYILVEKARKQGLDPYTEPLEGFDELLKKLQEAAAVVAVVGRRYEEAAFAIDAGYTAHRAKNREKVLFQRDMLAVSGDQAELKREDAILKRFGIKLPAPINPKKPEKSRKNRN